MKMPFKAAIAYFALANLIFIAGANGAIDAFFWGFLSFIIYWPFSRVTGEIWKFVEGTPPSIDNTHAIFLGLSAAQWLTYCLDVLAGTAWWWGISMLMSRLRARRNGEAKSNGVDSVFR